MILYRGIRESRESFLLYLRPKYMRIYDILGTATARSRFVVLRCTHQSGDRTEITGPGRYTGESRMYIVYIYVHRNIISYAYIIVSVRNS